MSGSIASDHSGAPLAEAVHLTRRGEIAVVTLDNPPVNVLSHHLREQLMNALQALRGDETVAAVVIACAGKTFVSGSDISEFGTSKHGQPPIVLDLCAALEEIGKPTIAAIHGTALGGGFELALACTYRVLDPDAKVGLPEVKLGLLPGAGGAARLPRLAGAENALRMVVSGDAVNASDAARFGIADKVATTDVMDEAVAFASRKAGEKAAHDPVRARDAKIVEARRDLAAFDTLSKELTRKTDGLAAPLACVEAVRDALVLPFDEAVNKARARLLQLVQGTEFRALRHLFFAEREALRLPGAGVEKPAGEIRKVGIVGAGTMGGGIAMAFANAGLPVTIVEANAEALSRGYAAIERNYGFSVSRGSLTTAEKASRLSRLSLSIDYSDIADCDLIVEAVFEDMTVKKEVFGKLDAVARPGAILATNTSYLDINEIAAATRRRPEVLGLHFFSPANVMRLVEIVRGAATAADTLSIAVRLAKRIGKVPVVVGVCHGFVGNRMLAIRGAQNEALLLEGASPASIDKAFTDFGWPMGPFQMGDLAGLDIGWRNRKAQRKTAAIADTLCELGRFGQKTGRGWYSYQEGSRTPLPDSDVSRLIEEAAAKAGIRRREITAGEIIERTHYPLINEGAKILQEGIATRSSDIDLVWVHGYGFPKAKGGPMFWAHMIEGLEPIAERLEYWRVRTGNELFVASHLRTLLPE